MKFYPTSGQIQTKDLTEIPENSVNHAMDCLLGGERQGGWFCEMKRNPICRGQSFIFQKSGFYQTNIHTSHGSGCPQIKDHYK